MKKLFFAFLFAALVALPAVAQQQQGQAPAVQPEQQAGQQAKAGQQADKTPAAQQQQKKAGQKGNKQAGDTKMVSLGKQKYNVTVSGPIKGLHQAEGATLKDENGNLLVVSRLSGSYGSQRWNNAINGVSPEKGYSLYKDRSGTPINHKVGQNGWITVFKEPKTNNRIVARYDRNPRTGEVTMLKKNVPNGASLSQAYEELKGASPSQFNSILNGARTSAATCSYGKCDGPDFIPQ